MDFQAAKPSVFALTALWLLLFVYAAALVVLGQIGRFWRYKQSFLLLLVVASVTFALQATFWTFMGTGYQILGHQVGVGNVQVRVVNIVNRMGSVGFLALFALFTFIIIQAVVGTVSPVKEKQYIVGAALALGIVTVASAAYGIAMAIIHAKATDHFVLDVSPVVLSGRQHLFSLLLCAVLFMTRRLVKEQIEKEEQNHQNTSRVLLRNSTIFVVSSVGLALLFLGRFVIACVWMFSNFPEGEQVLRGLDMACNLITAALVLAYISTGVMPAFRERASGGGGAKVSASSPSGYVPLQEEASVPLQYDV